MKKLDRKQIAARVAQDIPEGAYVNLGIGLPTLVANHVPRDREIVLHSENGILGLGPKPAPGTEDEDLIDAGKNPATALLGASYFHHADSFGMIRGGHIDICVLGAFQVSAAGAGRACAGCRWTTGEPCIDAPVSASEIEDCCTTGFSSRAINRRPSCALATRSPPVFASNVRRTA